VTDHETATLTARLTHLADELTPSADPLGRVHAARTRYRRQRRHRIAVGGLVAAAAVVALGVPTAIGAFSAAPERGEVAGPGVDGPGEKTPGPPLEGEDARKSSRWQDMLDEQAEREARLQPSLERVAAAFAARATPVSLVGPPRGGACPDWTPLLSSAFGAAVTGPDGSLPAGCRWSAADVVVDVAFVPGMTREELGRDATVEATSDECSIRAMPNVSYLAPLLLCEEEDGTGWRFRTVDASGAGVWRLTITLADGYDGNGAAVVLDLADLADRTW
jgi:hypothetical protein